VHRLTAARAVADVAAKGGTDYFHLVKSGRLKAGDLWMIAAGGLAYARAIMTGDATTERVRLERRAICAECRSRTEHPTDPAHGGYCGPLGKDRTHAAVNPTCGCPVEGVAAVASKACPQRKFTAVTVDGEEVPAGRGR